MAGFTQHVLAKALYDNSAEAPDELAFRKGDVVTVLEQNTSGLEGWWLCSLNGRQGIAPGNRLKLLVGMYENSPNLHGASSPQKVASPTGHGPGFMYDSPRSIGRRSSTSGSSAAEDYDVPRPMPNVRVSSPDISSGYQTIPDVRKHSLGTSRLQKQSNLEVYDIPPKQHGNQQDNYDVPPTNHWTMPTLRKSNSAHTSPTHSVEHTSPRTSELNDTPHKHNGQGLSPTEVYNVPLPQHCLTLPMKKSAIAKDLSDDYDIPVPSVESQLPTDVYDVPPSQSRQSPTEVYDIPPAHRIATDLYDSPKKIPDVVFDGTYDTPKKTRHPSLDLYDSPGYCKMKSIPRDWDARGNPEGVYDIPPQVTKDKPSSGIATLNRHQSLDEVDSKMQNLSVKLEHRSNSLDTGTLGRKVPLDTDTAMDLLVKRQEVLETAIAYMMSYVNSSWRLQANLQSRIHAIKSACCNLKLSLKDLLDFGKDIVSFAAKSSDITVQTDLGKSLQPLQESYAKLLRASLTLEGLKWSVDKLKYTHTSSADAPSDLDQFATTARSLPSDITKFVTFVHSNCNTLFQRTDPRSQSLGPQNRPLPTPPGGSISPENNFNWMAAEKESAPSPAHLQTRPLPHVPEQDRISNNGNVSNQTVDNKSGDYGYITKSTEIIVTDEPNHNLTYLSDLTSNDKEILNFYQLEVETISNDAISAVGSFFTCVDAKQPPKVFVAHSKHIIMLGHKLVFIGDTLHHNLSQTGFRARVIHMSDLLCDCLNFGVNATKTAALQYPAVQPIQEMVDRITDIANATQDLKLAILDVATT